jgi:CRISPR-associated protein Cmr3
VDAPRIKIAASAVMESWFSVIRTSTIQRLSSLTCGILTAKPLTVAVVSMFSRKNREANRPAQTRYWEYPDRNGSRLVRVVRVDDGEGNKKISQERWDKDKQRWLPGWGKDEDVNKVARASIPIYRYAEVQEAIAKGQPIYIVEGEPCADLLWKLGLAATTNIGGGSKFTLTDSLDLQGAELIVIVPDLDKKGIAHAEKVAEHFPEALWLYPFPTSKIWENLPEDHGLDIADWIEHEKLSATELRAAIGEKRVFKAPQAAAKVLTHNRFKAPSVDLRQEITALVNAGTQVLNLPPRFLSCHEVVTLSKLSASIRKYWKKPTEKNSVSTGKPT